MAVVEEVHRVNELLQRYLGAANTLANIYPYPADALRHMLYKELFFNGDGPPELSEADAAARMYLRVTIVTKKDARQMILKILDILIEAMTRENPRREAPDMSDAIASITSWLQATTPAFDHPGAIPSINSHIDHGVGSSTNAASSSSMASAKDTDGISAGIQTLADHSSQQASNSNSEAARLPASATITESKSHDTQRAVANSQAESNRPTTQTEVLKSPVMIAPQPRSYQQPAFVNMLPIGQAQTTAGQHQPLMQAQTNGYFPYRAPLQPAHFYPPPPMQHPMYGHNSPYLHYGPAYPNAMPPMGFPPPHYGVPGNYQPLRQPFHHQIAMIPPQHYQMPQPHEPLSAPGAEPASAYLNPRTSLPPAPRQATQSIWSSATKRGKQFNIAEWAQENRPTTPQASSASALPSLNPAPGSNAAVTRYGNGSDAMYPRAVGGPSQGLRDLTGGGEPTFTRMSDAASFPFEESARGGRPAAFGVIRIGNIPYGLTKAHIVAFLGPNTPFATVNIGCSVHIIMDRLTGKTYDCYVELQSTEAAQSLTNARNGQMIPLLDRVPFVQMSSQNQLLENMFPKARSIKWTEGIPELKDGQDPFGVLSMALVTQEEMTTMVRYAESPQRSHFIGGKCPQRIYEYMISTIIKFPWYAVDMYTVGTRNHIFTACRDLLRVLLRNVDLRHNPDLNDDLLEELLYTCLNCPGFSERQRWEFTRCCGVIGLAVRISPLAKDWPFNVLGRKPDVPEDVMEFYVDRLTRHLANPRARPTMNPFRTFLLPPNRGDAATFGEMGRVELDCVVEVYRQTLDG